jgi:hypothetical protein
LPWELMRDPAGPVALNLGGVSRALPVAELAQTAEVPGGRLRVLMVISRPAGTGDVGYQMIARPLLHRLEAVRGQVDLVVLRPPTLEALQQALAEAAAAEQPVRPRSEAMTMSDAQAAVHWCGRAAVQEDKAEEQRQIAAKQAARAEEIAKIAAKHIERQDECIAIQAETIGHLKRHIEALAEISALRDQRAALWEARALGLGWPGSQS